MSSNLLKSGWVTIRQEETRVIDSNSLIQKKIRNGLSIQNRKTGGEEASCGDGFLSGLNAETIEYSEDSQEEAVLKSPSEEEKEALFREIQQAREELASVKAEADSMIENAKAEITIMQTKAYEEAKNQGYQEGCRQGMAEADALKNEYAASQKQLEADYQRELEELEPKLIDALTGIYEHVFQVDLSDYKELVTGLLIRTMQKMDDVRIFMVHISREDYHKVINGRERILAETGTGSAKVEFIEDMTLSQSQCFIETENGIYDCSLGTELKELERKLKLLSYEK